MLIVLIGDIISALTDHIPGILQLETQTHPLALTEVIDHACTTPSSTTASNNVCVCVCVDGSVCVLVHGHAPHH